MTDTATSEQIVTVSLGARSYDIVIGAGLLGDIGARLTPFLARKKLFIVTERTVESHLGAQVKDALDAAGIEAHWFILEPGEATKSFSVFENLANDLLAAGIERSDTIAALGGGVIGDLTGFAAATVLRGVGFIQIPTTLLSQVDSSVGGKTGINTPHGKNLLGAFYQPKAVFIDTSTLNTLPRRELLAGYAEVAKYGLIDDPDFFSWLEEHGQKLLEGEEADRLRAQAIAHSCRAKARVVAEDERETGKRALLNLGHTFGHALEAECGYSGSLLHGEAVAIGMVMALEASARLGLAQAEDRNRLEAHFRQVGLKTNAGAIGVDMDADTLLSHMHKDKKVEAGEIGFILGAIGGAAVHRGVDLEIIRGVLHDSLNAD